MIRLMRRQIIYYSLKLQSRAMVQWSQPLGRPRSMESMNKEKQNTDLYQTPYPKINANGVVSDGQVMPVKSIQRY